MTHERKQSQVSITQRQEAEGIFFVSIQFSVVLVDWPFFIFAGQASVGRMPM